MRSWTASTLWMLVVVMSLYGFFPYEAVIDRTELLSSSTFSLPALEKSAQYPCDESPVGESQQNVCRAATRLSRPTIPVGAQVVAVAMDAMHVMTGWAPFVGYQPSCVGRCGRSQLTLLQTLRC